MKIVIDARMISWTGIGRYTRALIENLQTLDADNDYLLLLQKKDFAGVALNNLRFQKIEANIRPYSLGEQLYLPGLIASLKPDLVHFLGPNAPIFYFGKRITTIFDFTLLDYKNVRSDPLAYEVKYWALKLCFWRSVKASKYIITISNFVKNQVADRYHISPSKIIPISLAADNLSAEPKSIDHFNVSGPFLLHVGNSYPYKNILRLVEAFSKAKEFHKDLKLVMNGKPDYFLELVREQVKTLGAEGSILFPGYTTDGELAALYRGAEFFVFPTLSEGFGLPGLEAMAQGTPVLAANASCLPEVYADAASYFDPYDVADMAEKIDLLLGDKAELASLKVAGLARMKLFSWETMARQTLEVYTKTGSN